MGKELIYAELERQKIPQEKAVPQHRLGLIALYDSNSRAQTGLYKLRVAAEYRPFGEGAGRSVRGLPILWEPPSLSGLRGHQWAQPPEAIRGMALPRVSLVMCGVAVTDERV